MNVITVFKITVFALFFIASSNIMASGSFAPHSGGIGNASYNLGKAIYSGRTNHGGCAQCHKKFKRSALKKLTQPVADFISQCDKHTPCITTLNDKDKTVLNAYFKRRYRLK